MAIDDHKKKAVLELPNVYMIMASGKNTCTLIVQYVILFLTFLQKAINQAAKRTGSSISTDDIVYS